MRSEASTDVGLGREQLTRTDRDQCDRQRAHALTYDRGAFLKKKAHVRLYRFEVFQAGREKGLKAPARWLLTALTMVCDYKTGDYWGTVHQLAEDTGQSRNTITKAMKELARADLVQIVDEFGPNGQGRVRVLVLDQLVADADPVIRADMRERAEPHVRPFVRPSRAPTAQQPRTSRAATAQKSATAQSVTSDDSSLQESKEEGGKETNDSRDNVIALLKSQFDAEIVA